MKLSQFRRLIKEEVKKVLKEVVDATTVADYFEGYGVQITPSFNLQALATKLKMPQQVVATLLVNLEDDAIMKDIAQGKYDTFKPFDSSQFNDEYETVAQQVRLNKYMGDPENENLDKFIAFLKSNGITMLTSRRAYSKFNASEIDAYTDSKGTQRAERNFNLMKQKKNQIGTFLRNLLNTKQKIAIILSKDQWGDAFVSLVSNPRNPGSGGDEYFYL